MLAIYVRWRPRVSSGAALYASTHVALYIARGHYCFLFHRIIVSRWFHIKDITLKDETLRYRTESTSLISFTSNPKFRQGQLRNDTKHRASYSRSFYVISLPITSTGIRGVSSLNSFSGVHILHWSHFMWLRSPQPLSQCRAHIGRAAIMSNSTKYAILFSPKRFKAHYNGCATLKNNSKPGFKMR